ncbi:MAG: hypothetical protein R2849_15815 [Thermomicrobiales bacterium]
MHDTAFSVPAGKLDRLADAYSPDAENGTLQLADAAARRRGARIFSFPPMAAPVWYRRSMTCLPSD